METLYQSTPLYKKDTNGNIRIWRGEAFVADDQVAYYKTISGVLTGKQKEHVTEAKRSPKLSAGEAAVSKIQSAEASKRKKGYFETQEDAIAYEPRKLMILHKYPEFSDRLSFPILVQPKLDGVCAGYMDTDDPHFKSREDNRFEKLDGLAKVIKRWLDAHHGVDRERMDAHGELYCHGKTVSELVEGIKGSDAQMLKDLEFVIFDFMSSDAEHEWFSTRLRKGMKYYGTDEHLKPFRIVKTLVANDAEEVEAHYKSFIKQSYEGAILINLKGKYEYERRTYDKLKYKLVLSEEFEITGVHSELNGSEELIMFTCVTKEGASFKVRPKWDHERRAAALEQQRNGSINYIGEMATVEYRSMTAYKTPFHGVMISTRNYE